MPTSYTANVANGKITSVKEYIESCIPAFMIYFRDKQNINVREPLKFEFFYNDKLTQAKKEYANFVNSSEEQKSFFYKRYRDQHFEYVHKRIQENKEAISRYENMLFKLSNFKSPSQDHDAFVKFLNSKLNDSIEIDDILEVYTEELDRLNQLSFEQYVANKEKDLLDDVNHYQEKAIKEKESANQNIQWLNQILEAIDAIDEPKEI